MKCTSGGRYSRTEALPEIGPDGQRRISAGSVLVIGCGALGSAAASYLAGAGVGRLGLVDFDTVDISNLQRQVAYTEEDAGKPKCIRLADRLRRLNAEILIQPVEALATRDNISSLTDGYDFVVEGSDNPSTKMLVAAACDEAGISYCIGGVAGFSGQVMTHTPGTTRYSDIFPEAPGQRGAFTPCSAGGVLGPAAAVVASVQAAEALKYLSGAGSLLTDRLLTIDTLTMTFNTFSL